MSEHSARPAARGRAYQLVVDHVEAQILDGRIKVGDRLPGERELALRLEVSRAAVREGIRSLEAQGVVRSGVGSGPDAGTVVSALPSAALTRFLRLHVALANFPIPDVVEARVMLERSSARLAAGHGDQERLGPVAEALAAMDDPTLDQATFNALDTTFHIAIAEAGGNRLVSDITIAIRDAFRRPILEGLGLLGDRWPQAATRLRAEHHAIYAALVDGDETTAADLMEEHVRGAAQWLPG